MDERGKSIEEQLHQLNRQFLRQHSLVVTMQRTLDKHDRVPDDIADELTRLKDREKEIRATIRHLQEQL
jgi:septal ring factor EnvC (AmiA/AmiB activator)